MGLHKSEDNLAVSRRENASVLLEKDYKTKYDGFDPNSPEANIIFTLFQNAYMNQSISFASKIQTEIQDYAGRANRGVKQAGFLVLYRTAMPSVLIETGFLTSPSEEKYLLSEKGQSDIASSIFKAFKEYKIDMESDGVQEPEKKQPESNPALSTSEVKTPGQKDTMIEKENKKDSLAGIVKEKKEEQKPSKENKTPLIKDSTLYSPPPTKVEVQKEPVKNITSEKPSSADNTGVFYTIQVGASPASASAGLEKYDAVSDLKKIKGDDGMIRFTSGSFQNVNDAINAQTSLRSQGFKDAFVTAYFNNKRISLSEASKLLSKGTPSEKKN
jgi:N-acetylmuramoyl-L-alanine amidase